MHRMRRRGGHPAIGREKCETIFLGDVAHAHGAADSEKGTA